MNLMTSRRWRLFVAVQMVAICLAASLSAQTPLSPKYASGQVDPDDQTHVDIALVLAVDVSSSIRSSERAFQREAYAHALSDPRVANMALGGRAGRVAIAYMEWSGQKYQRVHLPMRIMQTPEELAQFGQEIAAIEDVRGDRMFLQRTAIGDALLAAEATMATLRVRARDYVIDISGDGILNDGIALATARDRLLHMGLTVNGLPIEVSEALHRHSDDADKVTRFYMDCVIGGPGAFHVVARGFGDVRETLIMKLMLELAQMPPAEKRRIAWAWNTGGIGNSARIIPAKVLQIRPPKENATPQTNCGSYVGANIGSFQSQH